MCTMYYPANRGGRRDDFVISCNFFPGLPIGGPEPGRPPPKFAGAHLSNVCGCSWKGGGGAICYAFWILTVKMRYVQICTILFID
jgi:hypothetical protein